MDWIIANKEWVFSGIGILILTASVGLFRKVKIPSKDDRKEKDSSINIQTHYGTGDLIGGDKKIKIKNHG